MTGETQAQGAGQSQAPGAGQTQAQAGGQQQSPFEFHRESSGRAGVTLMNNQIGHAVADVMRTKPNVTVRDLPSMIRVDAVGMVEFNFDELTDAVGEEFDQNAFEEIMSTHYGRMVALDDRMVLFANPEDAAEYLGFDLKPVSPGTS
jgi:propane monooxygenase coupling protein